MNSADIVVSLVLELSRVQDSSVYTINHVCKAWANE